jgi:galactokinase
MNSLIQFNRLEDLYSQDNKNRYDELIGLFENRYQSKPEYFARAPGRVNVPNIYSYNTS